MYLKKTQSESLADYPQRSVNNSLSNFAKMTILASFLILVLVPAYANAGIFSKIGNFFTGDVSADTVDNNQNSQNAPVLEPKVSPSNESESKNEPLQMNDDVLVTEVGALGSAADVEDYPEEDEINVYITKKGDTLAKIADMYNVTVNTIVWANDGIDPKKSLKEGTSLLIMPISGVNHVVKKGDTLAKIAKKYGADADEISKFNGVTDDTLAVGSSIVVPNGELASPKKTSSSKTAKSSGGIINKIKVFAGNGKGTSKYIPGYSGNSKGSYYRAPVRCIITQGLHGKNGIDLGCHVGTSVAAAADGTVIAAKKGWNGGYGNMIIISHPNGTQTVYGHLSRIDVSSGQYVNDGEIIGATGNSGQSTGPHLHFEIRGARNCFVDSSCR